MRIFFLAIIICFLGSVGFAKEKRDRTKLDEIIEKFAENRDEIYRFNLKTGLEFGFYHYENGEIFFITPSNMKNYDGLRVENVDLKTFKILDNNYYAKDKNNVYYYGQKLDGADSESFEILVDRFSRDKKNIYFCKEKILEIKPEMLENDGRIKFIYDGQNYDLKYNNK